MKLMVDARMKLMVDARMKLMVDVRVRVKTVKRGCRCSCCR